jgi:hypothetical protein
MCDTEASALELLECDDTFTSTLDPTNASFINLKDSVCYLTEDTKVYVCYNRPPLLGFDTATNTPEYMNPAIPGTDDPIPDALQPEYSRLCGSYQASYTMMHSGISTITTNLSQVNANLGILSNVYNTLNNIKTARCSSGNLQGTKLKACNAINNSINFFQNSLTNPSTTNMVNTLTTSLGTLVSLRDNELSPAYNGLGCITPTF